MKIIAKLLSYLLHPVLIPLLATGCYYLITSEFYQPSLIKFTLVQVGIMTFALPVVLYFLLRSLKVINPSIMLDNLNERKVPVFFNMILFIALIFRVWEYNGNSELKNYFIGYLITFFFIFIGLFLKKKISIHVAAFASSIPFMIAIATTYYRPLIWQTSLLIMVLGLLTWARLYPKAHTNSEVLWALAIGIIPQFAIRYVPLFL